jgi:hypothetical protein
MGPPRWNGPAREEALPVPPFLPETYRLAGTRNRDDDVDGYWTNRRAQGGNAYGRGNQFGSQSLTDSPHQAQGVNSLPIVSFAGWITGDRPVDRTQSLEKQQLEERNRQLIIIQDAINGFLVLLAGACGRGVSPADLRIKSAPASGQVVEGLMNSLRNYAATSVGLGSLSSNVTKALAAATSQLANPQSRSINRPSPTMAAGALSGAAAAGQQRSAAQRLLQIMGTTPSGAAGQALGQSAILGQLPAWLQSAIDSNSVTPEMFLLWMLTSPEKLDPTRLKVFEMTFGERGSSQVDEQLKQLDYANKLLRFYERTPDTQQWVSDPVEVGWMLINDDATMAIRQAYELVKRHSGMHHVPLIELMTHQHVCVAFAQLVAHQMALNDVGNVRRLSTASSNARAADRVHKDAQRFSGLRYVEGPPPLGRQLAIITMHFDVDSGTLVENPLPTMRAQQLAERSATVANHYAQTTGAYYTGASQPEPWTSVFSQSPALRYENHRGERGW